MFEAALLNGVLFLPVLGIGLLLILPAGHDEVVRRVTLGTMTLQFLITAMLYVRFDPNVAGLQFETRLPLSLIHISEPTRPY